MRIRWLPVLLLCLLLTGCSAAASGGYLIPEAEGSGAYSEVLLPFLSGYTLQDGEDTLYAEVARGNAVACFDVQAIPAMTRGVGRYWYPHVTATVVLAVDRTRTDAVITGWNSLRESGVSAGMSSFSVVRNMLAMGALSYGLDWEDPTKQDALDYLEDLHRNGGFELDGADAPVLICLDYEAAAWNQNGENYEIIVPEEGTLSYRMGLLSDVPLMLEPGLDEALLSAGLPLAGGERPSGFPTDYRSTHTLEGKDYDRFLTLAGDSSRDLRRQVFHTRLYTTADMREQHILSALLIATVILLWKGTVTHRMIRRDVRRVVDVLGWLMVGWLMLRLFKYQLPQESTLCRLCWYGYYLFQLALPVALLYLTEILDRGEGEKAGTSPVAAPCGVYPLGAAGVDQRSPSAGIPLYTRWKLGFGLSVWAGILGGYGLLPPVPGICPLESAPQGTGKPQPERPRTPTAVLRRLACLSCRLHPAGAAGMGERCYGQYLHSVGVVL